MSYEYVQADSGREASDPVNLSDSMCWYSCSLAITPNIRHALNARLDSLGVMAACCQQAVSQAVSQMEEALYRAHAAHERAALGLKHSEANVMRRDAIIAALSAELADARCLAAEVTIGAAPSEAVGDGRDATIAALSAELSDAREELRLHGLAAAVTIGAAPSEAVGDGSCDGSCDGSMHMNTETTMLAPMAAAMAACRWI